jgi:hypothetical protein
MLDADGVTELAELYATTAGGEFSGLQFTAQYSPGGAKDAIRAGIIGAYARDLAGRLHPHEVVAEGFIAKGASGQSTIPGHLDWSIVDETRHRSVNVWIPLCDTSESNGALAVVPVMSLVPAGLAPVHYVGAGDGKLREVQVDAEFFHSYVIDPDSDTNPDLEALIAGRPSRPVPTTAPITTDDIRGLTVGA